MIKLRTATMACLLVGFGVYAVSQSRTNAAQAAEGADANSYKIGVVNLQAILDGYKRQEQEVAKLQGEVDTRQKTLDGLRNKLNELGQSYQAKAEGMTEADRFAAEEDIEVQALELQAQVKKAEIELTRKRELLKRQLLTDIINAINTLANEENYHMVFEANRDFNGGLVFFATRIDMTQKVLDRLNK